MPHQAEADRRRQQVTDPGHVGVGDDGPEDRSQHDGRGCDSPSARRQQHARTDHGKHRVGDTDVGADEVSGRKPVFADRDADAALGEHGRQQVAGQRDQYGTRGAERSLEQRERDRHDQQIGEQPVGDNERTRHRGRDRMPDQVMHIGRGPRDDAVDGPGVGMQKE